MELPIVHYNEPILRQKGSKVSAFNPALAQFIADLIDTMHAAEGIGLAAQQVGRAVMVCVIDLRPARADFSWTLDGAQLPLDLFMPMALVNPVVSAVAGTDDYVYEEGCLSFPHIRGDVIRPDMVTVKYQDERGTPHELTCDGLLGRCVQHEVDHLHGVLFIERMEKEVRAGINDAVKALAKETRAAAKAAKTS
jgi:peptide deformylase